MTLATWHFHIEISSKCTLRCSRCARQEVPDTLVNTELDLLFFQKNFTPEFVKKHLEKITFCGDDGDPIYAHDLVPVIRYLKSIKNIEIVIVTNGSHKKTVWWQELASVLTYKDSVHFSIDGWDNESNNQYRINSDFDSIISGIKTLRSNQSVNLVWAAIAFRFNQDHISDMKNIAKSLGMDSFQLTKSTKFGSKYSSYGANDTLEPSKDLVSSSFRFERETDRYTDKKNYIHLTNVALYEQYRYEKDTIPLCAIGNKGLYIDAQGRLFPCCWVANRYSHNNEWQMLANNFNLNTRNLVDVLQDTFWNTELQKFTWQECQTKCSSAIVDRNYALSW